MSDFFQDIRLDNLRKAHLRQLLAYVEDRDREGWYYGNKAQFEKRHDEIKAWLKSAVEYAYSEGVVMPGNSRR